MIEKKKQGQIERFKDVARELGCDEDEAAFDRALKQMKPPADWPENTDQPADNSLDPGRR